jgi:myo-inositol-1(or 4)-monophosphatase
MSLRGSRFPVESPRIKEWVPVKDHAHILKVAQEAARAGGEVLERWTGRVSITEKARFDLVTEADHGSQLAIREVLQSEFPEFGFLGEETPEQEKRLLLTLPGPLWVVDPLDGTTNYVHRYPSYAVSIGLVQAGAPIVGVIYDPCRNEMFTAARSLGAALNGTPLRTTSTDALGQALIAVGFPPNPRGNEAVLEAWRQFARETQSLRRTGSSTLNLAYIAAGRLDGFFAFQQSPWDVAAGMLIVHEARGTVTDHDGRPYHALSSQAIAASNGPLHHKMVGLLSCVARH